MLRSAKNTKEQNGVYLNDRVRLFDKVGFITGFTAGACYVKDIFDKYITIPGKTYKQVALSILEILDHTNNWQFIPYLKERDFLPE